MKNVGILSLTENPFDFRMWAFYGGNSKGICLEFERTSENDLGSETTRPVTYVAERPQIKFTQRESKREEIITTKFDIWKYECEWRHWRQEGNRNYSFPGEVKRIIFGLNCHAATIDLVENIFGEDIQYEQTLLNNDYSIQTDCGLNHSLSKIPLT